VLADASCPQETVNVDDVSSHYRRDSSRCDSVDAGHSGTELDSQTQIKTERCSTSSDYRMKESPKRAVKDFVKNESASYFEHSSCASDQTRAEESSRSQVKSEIKTEVISDEEYARQLQEQLDKESDSQTIEPKCLRNRTISDSKSESVDVNDGKLVSSTSNPAKGDEKLQEDATKAKILPANKTDICSSKSGCDQKSVELWEKIQIKEERIVHDVNKLSDTSKDELYARRVQQLEETEAEMFTEHGSESCTQGDEELARTLQWEAPHQFKSTPDVAEDTKLARTLQYEAPHQFKSTPDVAEDAKLARTLQYEAPHQFTSTPDVDEDAELARTLQEEEDRKMMSVKSGADLEASDAEMARRMQLEEQESKVCRPAVSVEDDAEFARQLQMEGDSSSSEVLPTGSIGVWTPSSTSSQFENLPLKSPNKHPIQRVADQVGLHYLYLFYKCSVL